MSVKTLWKKVVPLVAIWGLCVVVVSVSCQQIVLLSLSISIFASMAVLDNKEYNY